MISMIFFRKVQNSMTIPWFLSLKLFFHDDSMISTISMILCEPSFCWPIFDHFFLAKQWAKIAKIAENVQHWHYNHEIVTCSSHWAQLQNKPITKTKHFQCSSANIYVNKLRISILPVQLKCWFKAQFWFFSHFSAIFSRVFFSLSKSNIIFGFSTIKLVYLEIFKF